MATNGNGIKPPAPFLTEIGGQLPVSWNRWKARMSDYFVAADLEGSSNARKKAILRRCLGEEGERLAEEAEDKDDYEDYIKELDKTF